jgi:RNA polymerase sigma factor (sigma-70 family)
MAQKVFICIHRLSSKGEFDILRQKPEPYLNKAARNMSLNEIKRKRSELNKLYDFATSESIKGLISKFENGQMVKEQYITDSDYEQVEAEIIIEAILAEQDETTRKIYFYKYHDDMVLKQIGELVGLKKSAVQKRIKKLEKQVKAVLGKVKK